MDSQYDPKKRKTVSVRTEDGIKEYPETPSTWESVKEVFEPTNTRAQLDAIRTKRAKYGS